MASQQIFNGQYVQHGGGTNFQPVAQWNQITNINQDPCTRAGSETQSQLPGSYTTSNWLRPCETQKQYGVNMTEPIHQYKVYQPDACAIPVDSQLRVGTMTNGGEIYQLFTRPYLGAYQGAGTNCGAGVQKDIESRLLFGTPTTTYKPCEPLSEVTINRFDCLPSFGNPQRVQHIVEPWVRGGEASRDYVRRVSYDKFCTNKCNRALLKK